MIQRVFASMLSSDVARASGWYLDLFDLEVVFRSDWFVHLRCRDHPELELGFLDRGHDIVTPEMRAAPAGGLLTIVVDDVDQLHRRALERGVEVLQPPTDLFYGQRRMLLVDSDGQVVDVSSECEPDPTWLATLIA